MKNDSDLNPNIKLGFAKLLDCLDIYLDNIETLKESEEMQININIYNGVTLENKEIM